MGSRGRVPECLVANLGTRVRSRPTPKFVSNFKWHKSDPCGVLSTPAMNTRVVTLGKRPHGKHISSSLPISAYKADWHTQQWVIRRDDIFIYFIFTSKKSENLRLNRRRNY